jgi:hypothetical protein
MALSLFNNEKLFSVNHYRSKPFLDGFLVTNDFGSWVFLSKREFGMLRHNNIADHALLSLLKEKGFVISGKNLNSLAEQYGVSLKPFFSGTLCHIIFWDESLLDANADNVAARTADFISQCPAKEITVEFKAKTVNNFKMLKKYVSKFSGGDKDVSFKIETDLSSMNNDLLEFLVVHRFSVWFPLDGTNVPDRVMLWIKELQRRLNINFYLDFSEEMMGKEQRIMDFFSGNGFDSFLVRKMRGADGESFVDFWKNIVVKTFELNKRQGKAVLFERSSMHLLNKIVNNHSSLESNIFCSSPLSVLAYNLKGEIYANEESMGIELFKLGDVTSSYKDIVSGEDAQALLALSLNGDAVLEKNVYKPYISLCPTCGYLQNSKLIPLYPDQRAVMLSKMLDCLFEKIIKDQNTIEFNFPVVRRHRSQFRKS